jgi:hypothetical protein
MWEERFSELSVLAARQEGMITTAQANRSGIRTETLDHFKEAGLIVELDWDVYQLAWSKVGPRYAYPLAAWLGLRPQLFHWERLDGEPDAVLSHESACNLHGMGSVSTPAEVFTTPEEREAPRGTRIHVSRLAPDDIMICAGVPVTTPRRTIVDLVRDWVEHGEIGNLLTDAVRQDLVDLQAVHRDLAQLAAEHQFPVGGREFLEYFTPDLPLESLSTRNVRAYATLMFPERVAELRQRVRQLLEDVRSAQGSGTDEGRARDEGLSLKIAAEIVGGIRRA